ncbi:MAG: PAS domain S-box protein, partial [Opitutaceae bacterium]
MSALTFSLIPDAWLSAAAPSLDPAVLLVLALVVALAALAASFYLYWRQAQQLQISDARYRDAFEHAVGGAYEMSPDGAFTRVNPALANIFGYDTAGEMLKVPPVEIGQLYVSPKRPEFLALFRTSETVARFESEIRRRDGSPAWIEETSHAVRD